MVFASPTFLFLFLPAVLLLHFLLPRFLRNAFLLLASLVFYAWGESGFVLLMLASIALNAVAGLLVERTRGRRAGKAVLAIAISLNLALLAAFKYANFLADNLADPLSLVGVRLHLDPVHLPIGISFFTFQAMSYVIDVYRRQGNAQRNPVNLGLYISLFPQLIAGPIVRYHHIAAQLVSRTVTRAGFAYGVRRFTVGLAKKVLVANVVAVAADQIFALPPHHLTTGLAWLAVVCYTIQIYFDFSGYSDMAIGLGRMLGFHFLENFNYPYISTSIRDFWRRWHISLSTWFRDYLYFPLGGSRRSPARVHFNLITVFFLCGLWHGASWTFVIWGLYHGLFLVIERTRFQPLLAGLWRPLRHFYALAVVMAGWVIFRSDTLAQAATMLSALVGMAPGGGTVYHAGLYWNRELALALTLGVIGSTPLSPLVSRWLGALAESPAPGARLAWSAFAALGAVGFVLLLVLSATWLSAGTYNPFIYFRF